MPFELRGLFEDINRIFMNKKRNISEREKNELRKLGFCVYGLNHPKIKIGNAVITLSSTDSDTYANHQTIRLIRKVLIKEYKNGNFKLKVI